MVRAGIDPGPSERERQERARPVSSARNHGSTGSRRAGGASGEFRPRRLWLAVGAGIVIVALVVAVVAVAAAASMGNGLPQGTMVFPENDHNHVSGPVTYDRVPPAGGPHNPVQLNCGVYASAVPNENAVHSLEHGAVWITFQPSLGQAGVSALTQVAVANYVGSEKYVILSPYAGIPAPIVASAWGAQLYVNSPSDPRLVQFIHRYAGGDQGGEPGGSCSGGVGVPLE